MARNISTIARLAFAVSLIAASIAGLAGAAAAVPADQPTDSNGGDGVPDGFVGLDGPFPTGDDSSDDRDGFVGLDAPFPAGGDLIPDGFIGLDGPYPTGDDGNDSKDKPDGNVM